MGYDSRIDTYQHIQQVQNLMLRAVGNLEQRLFVHDASKLESPEKEVFDEMAPKLKACTYGSDEYKGFLKHMEVGLAHHYKMNTHHPEHYRWHCPICSLQINDQQQLAAPQGPNDSGIRYCPKCCQNGMVYESELMLKPERGINGMSLLDILEMICDWRAASLRHADGDLAKSIEINQKRFGYTDELKMILRRTAIELKLF